MSCFELLFNHRVNPVLTFIMKQSAFSNQRIVGGRNLGKCLSKGEPFSREPSLVKCFKETNFYVTLTFKHLRGEITCGQYQS